MNPLSGLITRGKLRGSLALLIVAGMLGSGAVRADEESSAESLIPFPSLTETNHALVCAVTDHYTLRREFTPRRFAGRKEHFDFMVNNMEATSALAQKVGLITYRVERAANGRLHANDHAGADGSMLKVFTSPTNCIYYVEGSQNGVWHVHGRGVAVIDYKQSAPGKIEYDGALFVKVDNVVAATLAQLFSVFVRKTVDRQFDKVISQPIALTEAALADPQKLLVQINDMPEADRNLLAPLAEMLRPPASPR